MPEISWSDFEKIEIRAGTIIDAKNFEKARRPAYKLWIDFGDVGIKKSSAQITENYLPEQLIGCQVVAIVNFPPKQIADFQSECLVLGVYSEQGGVVLLVPGHKVGNGERVG